MKRGLSMPWMNPRWLKFPSPDVAAESPPLSPGGAGLHGSPMARHMVHTYQMRHESRHSRTASSCTELESALSRRDAFQVSGQRVNVRTPQPHRSMQQAASDLMRLRRACLPAPAQSPTAQARAGAPSQRAGRLAAATSTRVETLVVMIHSSSFANVGEWVPRSFPLGR